MSPPIQPCGQLHGAGYCRACNLAAEVERLQVALTEAHSRLAAAMKSAERSAALRSEAESKAEQAEAEVERLRDLVKKREFSATILRERDEARAEVERLRAERTLMLKIVASLRADLTDEKSAHAQTAAALRGEMAGKKKETGRKA